MRIASTGSGILIGAAACRNAQSAADLRGHECNVRQHRAYDALQNLLVHALAGGRSSLAQSINVWEPASLCQRAIRQ